MVDIQVTIELEMLLANTVQVTVLLPDSTVFPSLSIVNGTLILPHTLITEQVYMTFSFAAAEDLLT